MGSVNDVTSAHMRPPPQAGGIDSSSAANDANSTGDVPTPPTNEKEKSGVKSMVDALQQGFKNMSEAPTMMLPVRQAPPMPLIMQSDERSKDNVERSDMGEMLDTIKPVSWDYKDPQAHGQGRHWGFMAQDAQKSPAGASMIVPTSQGLMVDTRKAATLGLAAAAFNHRRIAALESAIKKGKES
jgi:hypothetical protein